MEGSKRLRFWTQREALVFRVNRRVLCPWVRGCEVGVLSRCRLVKDWQLYGLFSLVSWGLWDRERPVVQGLNRARV